MVSSILAHKGGQCFDNGSRAMYSALTVQDGRPKIVDTLLTLIFRRW